MNAPALRAPSRLRVLHASSEFVPVTRHGGLGEAVGNLPLAQRLAGHDARVVLPWYEHLDLAPWAPRPVHQGTVRWAQGAVTCEVFEARAGPVPFYAVRSPLIRGLFSSEGDRFGSVDAPVTFWVFAFAVADFVRHSRWRPDLVHCHDHHTGLLPGLLREQGRASVFTIHNGEYQGHVYFDKLPARLVDDPSKPLPAPDDPKARFVNFLRRGILEASQVTTVSSGYRRELLSRNVERNHGLGALLRRRAQAFTGIVNGITGRGFRGLAPARALEEKQKAKGRLLRTLGLADAAAPLVAVVARLHLQKGVDLILPTVSWLEEREASVVVMGNGHANAEAILDAMARSWPQRVAVRRFDPALEDLVFAGADLTLVPSRWEPCGLTQLKALSHGCLPVARATGGLADTIADGQTGFLFNRFSMSAFRRALTRALDMYGTAAWRRMQRNALREDNSWSARLPLYERVYRRALGR